MNLRTVVALVALSLIGVSQPFAGDRSNEVQSVSLINLIATPEKYHDKRVYINAYVTVEFENMSLCLSEHVLSTRDCLWLAIDSTQVGSDVDVKKYMELVTVWQEANHQGAAIQGTFDMNHSGHLGGWSGAIKNVTRVVARDVIIDFTVSPPRVERRRPRNDTP